MKRKIGLSESDLYRIVNRVIYEQDKGEKDIEDDEDMVGVDDEDIDDEDVAKYSEDEIEDKQEECRDLVDMLESLLGDLKSMEDSDDIFDLLSMKVGEIEEACDTLNNFVDGIEPNSFGI
jgi:hypothetical protein